MNQEQKPLEIGRDIVICSWCGKDLGSEAAMSFCRRQEKYDKAVRDERNAWKSWAMLLEANVRACGHGYLVPAYPNELLPFLGRPTPCDHA
jgi:hypothetical protein